MEEGPVLYTRRPDAVFLTCSSSISLLSSLTFAACSLAPSLCALARAFAATSSPFSCCPAPCAPVRNCPTRQTGSQIVEQSPGRVSRWARVTLSKSDSSICVDIELSRAREALVARTATDTMGGALAFYVLLRSAFLQIVT